MNDTALTVNQIVLDRTDQSSFRVLWISPDRQEAYWTTNYYRIFIVNGLVTSGIAIQG